MKKLALNSLLQLAVFCLMALTIEALAQGAYTDGRPAQLKASHIKKLKALRAPIAVPTYIPAGYILEGVSSESQKVNKNPYWKEVETFWIVDYTITYKNAQGDSFYITSANEGLGDVSLYGFLYGKNPFLDGEIEVGMQDEVEKSKQALMRGCQSGWIENKRAYLPAGARSRRQAYRVDSTALSAKEVLKVMESLRYLK